MATVLPLHTVATRVAFGEDIFTKMKAQERQKPIFAVFRGNVGSGASMAPLPAPL